MPRMKDFAALIGHASNEGIAAANRGAAGARSREDNEHQEKLLKLKDYLGGQARTGEMEQAQKLFATPGVDSAQVGDIRIAHRAPNPNAQSLADTRANSQKLRTITAMGRDYDKLAGQSPKQVRAAENLLDALERNDISTVGAVKASLPLVEGEAYKPSVAEMKAMMQDTGEGTLANLKNWFGGDNAALSKSQKEAFKKYVTGRLSAEGSRLGKNRAEILKRYQGRTSSFSPEDIEELSGTFGMSSEKLMEELQGKAHSAGAGDADKKAARILELEAKKARK